MLFCATNTQLCRDHLNNTLRGFHRFPIKCHSKTLHRNKHAILHREPLHILPWLEIHNHLVISKTIVQNGLHAFRIPPNDKSSQIAVSSSHFVSIDMHTQRNLHFRLRIVIHSVDSIKAGLQRASSQRVVHTACNGGRDIRLRDKRLSRPAKTSKIASDERFGRRRNLAEHLLLVITELLVSLIHGVVAIQQRVCFDRENHWDRNPTPLHTNRRIVRQNWCAPVCSGKPGKQVRQAKICGHLNNRTGAGGNNDASIR